MIRSVFLFLCIISYLFCDVRLLAPQYFQQGEAYDFSIEADGGSVNFPNISKIENYIVQGLGTSSSLTIINGKKSQKVSKKYRIFPDNDFTLPSFTLKIDDKEYKTNPLSVKQHLAKKTNSKLYDLEIRANKQRLYTGEDLILNLLFKYSKNAQIVDLNFENPRFENFWSKQIGQAKKYEKDGYIYQELNYLLFPQKSGKLKINPLKIDVATLDERNPEFSFFNSPTKVEKVYSNELVFDVKALPSGINLIGDFNIDAKVDKQEVKEGEAVSFVINIEGRGNIDDIKEYKLNVADATIYENEAKKNFNIKNGRYGGVYQKTFSIVASKDFDIEPIELKYFDINSKEVKTIYSPKYHIKVNSKKIQVNPILEKESPSIESIKEKEIIVKESSLQEKLLYITLGIFCGSLFTFLYLYFIKKTKRKDIESKPLYKKVLKVDTKDKLLRLMAPYLKIDRELDGLIYSIESLNEKEIKLKKKEILKRVKFLNL